MHMWQKTIAVMAVLGLLAASPVSTAQVREVADIDRIVAVVDDDVITWTELQGRVELITRQLQQQGTPIPAPEVLNRQILERMIVERIQLKAARERGIRVDDETVNQVVGRIAEENGMNLMQFYNVLERDGYSFAQFRENIRNEITISRLQSRELEGRISITAQEVDRLLENRERFGSGAEYRLSHIFISVPEAASPGVVDAARRKATEVQQRLQEGADFRQMAVAYSDGQKALEGGDLGWRKAGELPTLFAAAVVKMEQGAVSDLIRSPNGFHLLKLEERRGETRHTIRQTLARHILIRTDELTSDVNARDRLNRLRERILSGDQFGELARSYSDDTTSAVNGGDLGWRDPADFVPEFQQEIGNLDRGELSQPFKSRFGWHLVQVLDRRDYDNTDEYRRNQARELLRQRKLQEELQQWVRRMRDEAYVEYRLEG